MCVCLIHFTSLFVGSMWDGVESGIQFMYVSCDEGVDVWSALDMGCFRLIQYVLLLKTSHVYLIAFGIWWLHKLMTSFHLASLEQFTEVENWVE